MVADEAIESVFFFCSLKSDAIHNLSHSFLS